MIARPAISRFSFQRLGARPFAAESRSADFSARWPGRYFGQASRARTMTIASKRTSAMALRIVEAWNAAAMRWPPVAVIVIAWAVLALPLVFFRGYNSDEGLAVSIARSVVEDGEWLVPHMFNVR
jgi:hypothetical protein